jgi:cytochrome c-type biogenesis protein CcmH/NrfG
MGEWLLLGVALGAVALFVAWPLLGERPSDTVTDAPPPGGPGEQDAAADRETLALRHRLALEALRDVEADRRAGSLDDESYEVQRREAEDDAARTLLALEQAPATSAATAGADSPFSRRAAGVIGGILVLALVAGFALPGPAGIAERTETNQALADAIAREDARQAQIDALLDRVAADPSDTDALSQLADAYLAGSNRADLQRAAAALLLLINYDPQDASAYRRLITAYINAGAWDDASAALEAYADVAEDDDPDLPFFAGLIALRGDDDPAEAIRQFDAFLELAPDDPRAAMIEGLRAQAQAELDG